MSDLGEKHDVEGIESPRAPNLVDTKHIDGNIQLFDASGEGKARRVPIPSESPRDPLNWSSQRKLGVIIACCWFSIMSLALVGNAGPLIPYWIQAYHPPPANVSITAIINLTTWPSLFTGVGNYIFIPLCLWAGRRFSLLVASIMCLIATIGAGASQNYEGHMTARVFQGLASGVTESLLPLILTDITFVHRRGTIFAIYWTAQSILSSVFGISGPYIAASSSWRGYYWVFTGTCAFGMILNFFCIPESRFSRPPASIDGQLVYTDAYGEQITLTEQEAREKGLTNASDIDMRPLTFVETLKVWNGASKETASLAVRSYWEMAKCLSAPGLLWAIAYSGIVLGVNIAFSLTYANNLIENYGWAPSQTGLIQIATIPAGLLATVYSGFGMDWLAMRSARKNGGVHTVESRLPIIVIPSIFVIIGTVCYGYTLENPEMFGGHWIAPVAFFAMMVFGFISSLITTTTFAVECCPRAPGPALVLGVGGKNLVAFGLSYGLVPLVMSDGGVYSYATVLGTATAGATILAIPVYYFNPTWRKWASGKVVA
ncbi:hypothetical protein OIO90_005288 [Microbotryomycetes sp. JL221]|nr:hypothetical protein OIO90_005288 [Microbotryomycetes sp. JL221]